MFQDHDTKGFNGCGRRLWATCNCTDSSVDGIVGGAVGSQRTRGVETIRCENIGQIGIVRVDNSVHHVVHGHVLLYEGR